MQVNVNLVMNRFKCCGIVILTITDSINELNRLDLVGFFSIRNPERLDKFWEVFFRWGLWNFVKHTVKTHGNDIDLISFFYKLLSASPITQLLITFLVLDISAFYFIDLVFSKTVMIVVFKLQEIIEVEKEIFHTRFKKL